MSISNLLKENDFSIYANQFFDKDGPIVAVVSGAAIQLTFGGNIQALNEYLNFSSYLGSLTSTIANTSNEYIAYGNYKLKSISWSVINATGGNLEIIINGVSAKTVGIATLTGFEEVVPENILLSNLATVRTRFTGGTPFNNTQFNLLFIKQ